MNDTGGSTTLESSYREFLGDLWIRRLRVMCVLGIACVAAGTFLDWNVYTDLFPQFVLIRLITILLFGVILSIFYTHWAHRYYRVLGSIFVVIPIGHLSAMIAISNGIMSPYYFGNILVITSASLFLPYVLVEFSVVCLVTWIFYGAACLANWFFVPLQEALNGQVMANNVFFMILFPIIGLVSCHVSAGSRYREFKLRFDLDQNKRELEVSYGKLATLDHAKSQFFAHISHELRTPLTLILSPLDQLRVTLSD